MAGKAGNFAVQNRPFVPGKDDKVALPKKPTTFQPSESGGMTMPSPDKTSTPLAPVKIDAFASKMSTMKGQDAAFRVAASGNIGTPERPGAPLIDTSGYKDSPVGQFFANTGGLNDADRAKLKTRGGNYDETVFRNKNKSGMTSASPPMSGANPALIDRSMSGIERFDKTKLTLGNTPSGKIGMFKNGEMLNQKSLVGKMGPMGSLSRDYSGQAGLDQQVFEMSMARAKDGTLPAGGPFGPPGQGAGTYSKDSLMQQDVQRRDMLLSQIDGFNRKNTLGPNAKLGDIVNNAMATRDMRREVKGLNDNIFGRSDLANKIQMALLDSGTKQGIATQTNQTDLAKQGLENQGQFDTRQMMEGNENLRTGMQIQAGQYAPKGSLKDDPWEDGFMVDVGKKFMDDYRQGNVAVNMDDYIKESRKYATKARGGNSAIVSDILNKHKK